jgi:hypothetical protein
MDTDKKYIVNGEPTKEKINEILDAYGVAIIPNVLTLEECEKGIVGMWEYLEGLGLGIDRNLPETYVNFYKLMPSHGMLIQHWSIGQAEFAWLVRQHPKIVGIYAQLYNVNSEDLIVSMDGASLHFPPEITKRGAQKRPVTYHSEQSFMRPDRDTIQAWVNFFDTNSGDATLAFWEASHQYHATFREQFPEIGGKKNWYQFKDPVHLAFYQARCQEKRVVCPKGSLVLWDSRTIHTGIASQPNRVLPNYRAVVYVCYQPRSFATAKQLEKKQKAYENLRLTSHHPIENRLFPKHPRTYGLELPTIIPLSCPAELTSLGKRLVGYP